MAGATVTVRELKNKETGIDLSVTGYKVTKGMVGSTYDYEVVVVSNLQVFKSAKHKEGDTVQFTVHKKLNEFEEVFTKLNTKFSGTVFPALPKKVLMMNDSVAKERRVNFDTFVKFLATNSKISTSAMLLEFLGVSSMRSSKLQNLQGTSASGENTPAEKSGTEEEEKEKEEEIDMFAEDQGLRDDDEDDDIFADESLEGDSVQVFDEVELGGAVTQGEDNGLFNADALPDTDVKAQVQVTLVDDDDDEEEKDDLFRIDDDLDQIMELKLTPDTTDSAANEPTFTDVESRATEDAVVLQETGIGKSDISEATGEISVDSIDDTAETNQKADVDETVEAPAKKPVLKPKPEIKQKPALPKKPDSVNPTSSKVKDYSATGSGNMGAKPTLKTKPELRQKPVLPKKPAASLNTNVNNDKKKPSDVVTVDSVKDTLEKESVDITEDDVMKYIQANTVDNDDVSLFD